MPGIDVRVTVFAEQCYQDLNSSETFRYGPLMQNLVGILKLLLVTFVTLSGIRHARANTNKKAQEKINTVMSGAMKSSDLPTVIAVDVDSEGNRFDFMHRGLSWVS